MNRDAVLAKIGIKDSSFEFLTVTEMVKRGLIEKPLDGNHGEIHPKEGDFVALGVPFIMASDINDGVVDYVGCKFITRKQADSLRKGFAKNGDVLLTHKATIGRTAIVKYDEQPYIMLTPQVTYYRVRDTQKLDRRYLRYYFESKFFQGILALWAGAGSTRAYLGITEQGKLPFVLPPIKKQRKIAAILSAYDDLIENNRRRIALLETIAKEIYREWFVRFRFPGSRNVKTTKGIPEGWTIRNLAAIAVLVREKYLEHEHQAWPLVDLEKMAQRSLAIVDTGHPDELATSRTLFAPNDVLFSTIRPYLYKVNMAPFYGVTNTSVMVLRPRIPDYRSFLTLVLFVDSTIAWADQYSSGTKMPVISWNVFQKMPLLDPGPSLVAKFNDLVSPILNQINSLSILNNKLSQSRDLLLPRLISGKCSVETLDIQFPPSMQNDDGAVERQVAHA